jgi:NAD-dependent deacetylase
MQMTSGETVTITGPVVFFTGAGASVGAGLPTYRGTGGLYEDTTLEPPHARDVTLEGLPALWARFGPRLRRAEAVTPAPAHQSIAALEHDHDHELDVTVVTQNVDGLHTAAGSTSVLELHGSLQRVRCMESNHTSALVDVTWRIDGVPLCPTCGDACRPDVVLFGESLPAGTWDAAAAAIRDAATIVGVGTSAQVYPAVLLIADDHTAHARRIWVNPETPPPTENWDWMQATADEALVRLLPARE